MYNRARYYDPQTGEFISRDPLEYVDGMSLYRGYFVPGGTDPTGLEWEVERSGESWAVATPSNPNSDSIDDLATMIGLDSFAYSEWLKHDDPNWEVDSVFAAVGECPPEFKVPNHVGAYTAAPNFFDFSLAAAAGRRAVRLSASSLQSKGFKVTRYLRSRDRTAFRGMWTLDGVAGVLFAGHGNAYGFAYDASTDGAVVTPHQVRSPPYRLSFVVSLACFSGNTFTDSNGRSRNWGHHVSQNGFWSNTGENSNFLWDFPIIVEGAAIPRFAQ